MKKSLLIVATALMTLAPSAPAAVRGFISVGPRWGGWYGPDWGPGPYWGPTYVVNPNLGEIKLDTKVKDAQVFINGAYAGTTHENKTMHLRPGSYNVEIREGGRTMFAQRLYVAVGKTIKIHPEL